MIRSRRIYMRRLAKILPVLLIAAILLSALGILVSAEGASGEWRVGDDGEIRYYLNGELVKGVQQIGSYYYIFDEEDGAYEGVYDSYVAVGTPGTQNTAEYRAAIKALGAGRMYGFYSFDADEILHHDNKNSVAKATAIYAGTKTSNRKHVKDNAVGGEIYRV